MFSASLTRHLAIQAELCVLLITCNGYANDFEGNILEHRDRITIEYLNDPDRLLTINDINAD